MPKRWWFGIVCGTVGAILGSGVGIAVAGSALAGTVPGFVCFFIVGIAVAQRWRRLQPSRVRVAIACIVGVLCSVLIGFHVGIVGGGGGMSGALLLFAVPAVLAYLLLPAPKAKVNTLPTSQTTPSTVTPPARRGDDSPFGFGWCLVGFIVVLIVLLVLNTPVAAPSSGTPVPAASVQQAAMAADPSPRQELHKPVARTVYHRSPPPCVYKEVMTDSEIAACR